MAVIAVRPPRTALRALEIELTPGPGAPALGRRALERLGDTLSPGTLADLMLVASELVTNCILHAGLVGGDVIRVRVAAHERGCRIEVEDPGRGFTPRAVPAGAGHPCGRGLALVDRVAARWGIFRAGTTLVWAELGRPG